MLTSDMPTDRRTLLKLSLLAASSAWRPAWGADPAQRSEALRDEVLTAAQASNQLATDLCQQLGAAEGNMCFSPASIAVALAMAADGATGRTREEMLHVLHAGDEPAAWLTGLGGLSRLLNATSDSHTLRMANRLWGQQGYEFHADYLQRTERNFAAPLGQVDFRGAAEASRAAINMWVSEQTNERIPDLLPAGSITTLTRLVLTNAIYFKADWREKFDKSLTRDEPFHLADGSQEQASLMHQQARFRYTDDDAVQVLEMPYKAGGLSMVVVLPRTIAGLAQLESSLTADRWAAWTSALRSETVRVTFPKFKVESTLNLNQTLAELGMPRAFGEEAEFGRMTSADELQISDVVHKAFVEVDETGTEAAAATGVVIGVRSAVVPQEPKVFRADHPFLFAIRHQPSNAILFLGSVNRLGSVTGRA